MRYFRLDKLPVGKFFIENEKYQKILSHGKP